MSRVDDLFDQFPKHLTVEQLAQVLGVTKNTAYKWLRDGYLPAYKVGGGPGGRPAWVILRDEVKDYLLAHRNQPGEEEAPD